MSPARVHRFGSAIVLYVFYSGGRLSLGTNWDGNCHGGWVGEMWPQWTWLICWSVFLLLCKKCSTAAWGDGQPPRDSILHTSSCLMSTSWAYNKGLCSCPICESRLRTERGSRYSLPTRVHSRFWRLIWRLIRQSFIERLLIGRLFFASKKCFPRIVASHPWSWGPVRARVHQAHVFFPELASQIWIDLNDNPRCILGVHGDQLALNADAFRSAE